MQVAQLIIVPAAQSTKVDAFRLREAQTEGERVEDARSEGVQRPEEVERKGAETGEERLGQPDVGVGGVGLAADVVGFLLARARESVM